MKRLFFALCVGAGIVSLYREYRPDPRFAKAAGVLEVERLGEGGKVIHEDFQPRQAPYLAVYHGAGWCEPCQQFSPTLEEFYHKADKTRNRFQLVMVSDDASDAEMLAYMREAKMEFPALRRRGAGAWGATSRPGIPNLLIIDTNTGRVVSSSFRGDDYVGCGVPLEVLRTIIARGRP